MNVPHHTPTDPLKGDDEVAAVTRIVEGSPRDYALFVMGTNTAFRASDILSLNCGDVRHLKVSGLLRIKEKKTSKYRTVTINEKVVNARQAQLASIEPVTDDEPLFRGSKCGTRLTVETFGRLVKKWCEAAGLEGQYASHTLRKTFGYTMRTKHNVSLDKLQQIYGHTSGAVTLKYVAIQADEIAEVYMLGV